VKMEARIGEEEGQEDVVVFIEFLEATGESVGGGRHGSLFFWSAKGWGGKGRVEFLIVYKGGLGIFEIPLRDPGVFFGGVSFPSDQEEVVSRGSTVA